jgi:hypothetical protein
VGNAAGTRFPLAQFPNAPLLVAVGGRLLAQLTDGSVHADVRARFRAGLAAWASWSWPAA